MRLKDTYITHEMDEDHILVPVGEADFSGIVKSNGSAAFIIEYLKEDVTEEDIISAMYKEYDAPKEQIARAVSKVLKTLREIGAIDE